MAGFASIVGDDVEVNVGAVVGENAVVLRGVKTENAHRAIFQGEMDFDAVVFFTGMGGIVSFVDNVIGDFGKSANDSKGEGASGVESGDGSGAGDEGFELAFVANVVG